MSKLSIIQKQDMQRVWAFIIPACDNTNNPIKSIPPLKQTG
jgi:hypothetical protein